MFTGIIREIGTVEAVERDRRRRAPASRAPGSRASSGRGRLGAVDGVCLTATSPGDDGFEAEVMNQTLVADHARRLEAGGRVNLELALRAGEPLGGHIVQGHVDGIGDGDLRRPRTASPAALRVALPDELLRYVVEHGSVALDGVSLTVAALDRRTGSRSR